MTDTATATAPEHAPGAISDDYTGEPETDDPTDEEA